jgi:hypothetical protein
LYDLHVCMCRRVHELATERQRAADAERALEDARVTGKAELEHLEAQLSEVRGQAYLRL